MAMKKAHKYEEDDNDLSLPVRKNVRRPSAQVKEAMPARHDGQLAARDVEVVRRSLENIKARNERVEQLKAQGRVCAGAHRSEW